VHAAAVLSLAIVPVFALLRLYQGFIRGLGRAVAAQFPDRGLRPVLLLFFVTGAAYSTGGLETGGDAIILNFLATAIGLVVMLVVWERSLPYSNAISTISESHGNTSFKQALPFALIAGVSVINNHTDVIMLGMLTTPEETGIYRIASRIASLVSFALVAIGTTLAPRIAELHATGRNEELQALATKAAMVSTALAAPVILILIFQGSLILGLFGEEFQKGVGPLAILSVGQLVSATMPLVGYLLSMTGYQNAVAKILTSTAFLNVVLNAILIPAYGAIGAAFSTMLTVLAWSTVMAIRARQLTGVDATVLAIGRRGRR
jgi:O-antigen/teichoic acid export membrane protein